MTEIVFNFDYTPSWLILKDIYKMYQVSNVQILELNILNGLKQVYKFLFEKNGIFEIPNQQSIV